MILDNEIDEPELMSNPIPKFQPPPTSSGRQRRFPRHYQDFLPSLTTNIPHMPKRHEMSFQLVWTFCKCFYFLNVIIMLVFLINV